MSENIVVYGASSAIVQGTLRHFASEQANFVLIGRKNSRLESVASDLRTMGASSVEVLCADLNDFPKHENIWKTSLDTLGSVHRVLIGHGSLSEQKLCEKDYPTAEEEYKTNFLSVVSILTPIANHFELEGRGQIAAISSVAGDRGRASNYIYGSSKAALSAFLSGLRQRLSKRGVNVLTIKPGFVDTPMTQDLKKNPLFADPQYVGEAIFTAMKKNKDILYTPNFWFLIMTLIKVIPEKLFKKLPL